MPRKIDWESQIGRRLKLRDLHIFVTVAHRGSMAKAAEQLGVSPSAVSEVISDPNSGHYIYKLVSKETLSVDTVKPEIRNTISSQRYRDSMQGFQGNVDLNDAYFGPTRNPAMPPPPRGARPPAQQAEDPD